MEQPRKRDGRTNDAAKRNVKQEQRQNKAPQGLEGMNFEEQRGSLKNSDYGGAIRNTSSGRNSSDVSQDEIKWVERKSAFSWFVWDGKFWVLRVMCEGKPLGKRSVGE